MAKTYGPTSWHTYTIDGVEYNFKCNSFETPRSWGHEVEFKQGFNTLNKVKCNYYNRTWEMWTFQTCMLKAVREYLNSISDEQEEARINKLYDMIDEGNKGDEANLNESRKYQQPSKTVSNSDIVDRVVKALKENGFSVAKSVIEADLNNMANDSILEQDVDELIQYYIDDYNSARVNKKVEVKSKRKTLGENVNCANCDKIEEDIEENTQSEEVSLLDMALNDIPTIGVENWGKDNELYFLVDTKVLFENLKDYEIKISKSNVQNTNDDIAILDYLKELGFDPEIYDGYNTYNWGAPLTHDIEYYIYKGEDKCYFVGSIHRSGDVRGNYTNSFLLEFDNYNNCIETIWDTCNNECYRELTVDNNDYIITPHFFDEYVDVHCTTTNKDWSDVYCTDIDTLKEIVTKDPD